MGARGGQDSTRTKVTKFIPVTLAALLVLISCGGSSGGGAAPPIALPPAAPAPTAATDLAITNVRVIAMDDTPPANNMTVRIDDGVIIGIGPTATTAADAVQVIDGSGKTLLPGLIDSHVHINGDHELALFVANGVTTVRNMWGTATTLSLRQQVAAKSIIGPTIVTSGPLIDGQPPIHAGSDIATSAQQGRDLVRAHKAAGYDFIKVYTRLPTEAFDAIASESELQGLRFAGHYSRAKGFENVLRTKLWSLEHLDGFLASTVNPASGYNPAAPDTAVLFAILRDIQAGTKTWADLFDAARLQQLATLSASSQITQVPTLTLWQNLYTPQSEYQAALNRPELRYVSPNIINEWKAESTQLYNDLTEEQVKLFRFLHDQDFRIVAALRAAGNDVVMGTDARNKFVVHGFAVHDELALLVRAGMTPLEALKAATINGARFLNLQNDVGTIATGKRADLVLFSADPTQDIANSRTIFATVARGRYFSRSDLDSLLQQVDARF